MKRIAVFLAFASAAWSQCSTPYAYQREVTVNSGQVTGTLSGFTRTVSGADMGTSLKTVANGGRLTSANGYDVVFVDAAGSALPFELVGHGGASTTYSATTGAAEFHVLVPSEAVGTAIYACYGAASITTYQGSDAGAWNSNAKVIQHFPNASTLSTVDSKQGFTFTATGTPTAVAGQVGTGAINFTAASSQYIQTAHNAMSTAMSMTVWIKAASFPGAYNTVLSSAAEFFDIHVKSTGKLALYTENTVGTSINYDGTGSHTLSAGTWYHIAMTYDSTSGLVGYVNGAVDGTAGAAGNLNPTATVFTVGSDPPSFTSRYLDGSVDEVHVFSGALSAAWVAAEYNNGISTTGYYTVGSETLITQAMSAAPTSIPANVAGQVITLSGSGGTLWDGTTIFTVTGGTKTAQNVTSNTAATITVTTTGAGTLAIHETITGSTSANVTVYPTFTTRVIGATSTQVVLQYNQGGSCTVEVSESPTYSPLAHDVDSTLFTGAATDTTRTDAIIAGSLKTVPIGKRFSQTALDSSVYSRALQTFTPQYFRITCGSAISTGYAHTTNIPLGNTRNDVPQVDTSTPGAWLMPTMPDVRNAKIIDPQTGALLQRVTTSADKIGSSFGLFQGFGGIDRRCAFRLQSAPDGTHGYLCVYWQAGDERGALFYYVTETKTWRNLGGIFIGNPIVADPHINDDMQVYAYNGSGSPVGYYTYTYNGDFTEQSSASFSAGVLNMPNTAPAGYWLNLFDPTFNPASYDCGFIAAPAGQYAGFYCPAPGPVQDSYGWMGVWYGGDGRAADPTCSAGPTACPHAVAGFSLQAKNCLNHNWTDVIDGGGVIEINTKSTDGSCTLGGFAGSVWWNYFSDPTGVGITVDPYWPYGGHIDPSGPLGRVTESGGWGVVLGVPVVNYENLPLVPEINDAPTFQGVFAPGSGNTISKHPSWQQDRNQTTLQQQNWFSDFTPWDGGNLVAPNPAATSISGDLYSYVTQAFSQVSVKNIETAAVFGGSSLRDISSAATGNVIGTGAGDNYKFCIAYKAGECRTGSSAGDIFVNMPSPTNLYCVGGDGPWPFYGDICLGPMNSWANAVGQHWVGSDSNTSNQQSRVITRGIAGFKQYTGFSTAKPLPDASWMMFQIGLGISGYDINVWGAKLPPWPPVDTINRTQFQQTPVVIPQGPAGTTNAIVRFGYLEYGTAAQYYCTTRAEACVAGTSTSPFAFPSDGSGGLITGLTGTSCATGCTVNVPTLSQRVLYFSVDYRDSGNATLSSTVGLRVIP